MKQYVIIHDNMTPRTLKAYLTSGGAFTTDLYSAQAYPSAERAHRAILHRGIDGFCSVGKITAVRISKKARP